MFFKKGNKTTGSIGTQAEIWAQTYLEQQGLTLVTRNYRTTRGEIDLIMQDNNTLVFVEVRLRGNARHGSAKESINPTKQHRLIFAAEHYLQTKKLFNQAQCRFDAICLDKDPDNNNRYQVEWLRNAFSA